jgi:hypothetical protein
MAVVGDALPVPMVAEERAAWAYLVTVVVTTFGYLAVMLPRLLSTPVEQISWVGPPLCGAAGAVAETTTKIRLYRRGF